MNSTEEKIHIYAWSERFLYLGPSTKTSSHRNHATTWLIAREGKLRVTLASGGVLENQVIYLPSETEYATAIWHRRASRRCIGNWRAPIGVLAHAVNVARALNANIIQRISIGISVYFLIVV